MQKQNNGPKNIDLIGLKFVDVYEIDNSEIDHHENRHVWDPQYYSTKKNTAFRGLGIITITASDYSSSIKFFQQI